MMKLAPCRDLTRSVDLTPNLPKTITEPVTKLFEKIRALGEDKQKQLKSRLQTWEEGFQDIHEMEKQLQAEITGAIAEDGRVQELAKALQELIDLHLEKFQ